MKGTFLASALALASTLAVSGCATQDKDINDHWNARSTAPRMARFFLGYDASRDGDYRDFAWERKQSINLTLRRHFLHHNPDNPNHPEWPGRYKERPLNSPLPNPVNYIHLEGILIGFALTGTGAAFFPLPIDSIIGTFQPGGFDEFWAGVRKGFTPFGVLTSTVVGLGTRQGHDETIETVNSVGE